MGLNELFKLEKEGIGTTIHNYTTDNFVKSYSKQLMELRYPEDKELLKVIIHRLLEWYDKNIEFIRESNYIYNKEGHEKSYILLQEISSLF